MTLYQTESGNYILQHGGYTYYSSHLYKTDGPLRHWRCSSRKNNNSCGARAVLRRPDLLELTKNHDHGPEQDPNS